MRELMEVDAVWYVGCPAYICLLTSLAGKSRLVIQ